MTTTPAAPHAARIDRLRQRMDDLDVDAVLLGPSADLRWAVGMATDTSERLTMLVVPRDGDPTLVVPRLEEPLARAAGVDDHAVVRAWDEVSDPLDLVADLVGHDATSVAVQDHLWTGFTLGLQERLGGAAWRPGSDVTGPLRLVKDAAEIAALEAAGAAIDEVHAAVPGLLVPGRTELQVAADIAERIRATHDEVTFVIVAAGPNGASPHHHNSARPLERGDAVVVDIGGTVDGYGSDETRNYAIGTVPSGYQAVHDVLEGAQAAAAAAARPGVTAAAVDAAAREPIAAAGHGPHFVHRTGHGIGLDGHEPPWIVAGNDQVLVAGMAFSIEPGIYVPGRFGARIEDIVVLTEDGAASVNHRPRSLVVT